MRLIVLGASGMWGHQVFMKFSDHFGSENVAGTLKKPKAHFDRIKIFQKAHVYDNVDFTDFKKASQCLSDFKPNVIVNCVGLTPRKYDVKNETLYKQINSELPHHLATWAGEHKSKLIHFSTDCVFTGKKGEYTEFDVPDAQDVYGSTKAAGEIKSQKQVLTFRLSKVGRELEGKTEIVEWLLSQRGKMVKGFSKAMYSGVTTNFMADELIRIIEMYPQLSGLYQVAGQKISKLELLKQINAVYQCDVEILENSDYALDKSLNSETYEKATGFRKPSWPDMLATMKKEERVDYDSFK